MRTLMDDLNNAQREFDQSSQQLLDIVRAIDLSYEHNVGQLSDILGHMQYQDVMKQRMEHVQEALVEMRDHLLELAQLPETPCWDGTLPTTFRALLDGHVERYRMASQTQTHMAVIGEEHTASSDRPAIELF